jgi:DoxX-like family
VLGAIAIVSGRSRTLKEWAYAGYTFDLLGAIASHLIVGDSPFAAVPAVVMVLVLTSYLLWSRLSSQAASPSSLTACRLLLPASPETAGAGGFPDWDREMRKAAASQNSSQRTETGGRWEGLPREWTQRVATSFAKAMRSAPSRAGCSCWIQ